MQNELQEDIVIQAFADDQTIVINGRSTIQIQRAWEIMVRTCTKWPNKDKLEENSSTIMQSQGN